MKLWFTESRHGRSHRHRRTRTLAYALALTTALQLGLCPPGLCLLPAFAADAQSHASQAPELPPCHAALATTNAPENEAEGPVSGVPSESELCCTTPPAVDGKARASQIDAIASAARTPEPAPASAPWHIALNAYARFPDHFTRIRNRLTQPNRISSRSLFLQYQSLLI